MPRDSGGTYTLPAGNPVVSGTVIASSWANTTMDDVAIEMTDSLSRTGNGAMQAALKHIDGAETSPSQTFNNDPLTGRYLAAVSDMRDTVAGVDKMRLTAAGLEVWIDPDWVPVINASTVMIQTDFDNVQGQTEFVTTEVNASVGVCMNGVLLAVADYVFTLGTTVTLVEAVKSADDIVSIIGYGFATP